MNIFFDNIPEGTTLGIDLTHFVFQVGQPFHGFKNIPQSASSIHCVHFQHGHNGLRYGYWFNTREIPFVHITYDSNKECMTPQYNEALLDSYSNRFLQCQQFMLDYTQHQKNENWPILTDEIRWLHILHWCETPISHHVFPYLDSSVTTMEESTLLHSTLTKNTHSPKSLAHTSILAPPNELSLRYTPIRFKSSEAIRPDHRMLDFLDKSYYLTHVILPTYHHQNINSLLGELQFAFLNSLLFANYGSALQWHNILELFSASSCLISDPSFSFFPSKLDTLLSLQLSLLPTEYAQSLLNLSVLSHAITDSHLTPKFAKSRTVFISIQNDGLVDPDPDTDADADADTEHDFVIKSGDQSDDDEDGPVVVSRTIYGPM